MCGLIRISLHAVHIAPSSSSWLYIECRGDGSLDVLGECLGNRCDVRIPLLESSAVLTPYERTDHGPSRWHSFL